MNITGRSIDSHQCPRPLRTAHRAHALGSSAVPASLTSPPYPPDAKQDNKTSQQARQVSGAARSFSGSKLTFKRKQTDDELMKTLEKKRKEEEGQDLITSSSVFVAFGVRRLQPATHWSTCASVTPSGPCILDFVHSRRWDPLHTRKEP